MKRIAFIPCGVLPIPAVKGGAVENLVQQLLDLNERYAEYEIIVYSPFDTEAILSSHEYKNTKFVFIKINGLINKMRTAFYRTCGIVKSMAFTYDFQNHFLHEIIRDMKKREKMDLIILENAPKYAIEIRKNFHMSKIIQHYHNIPEEQHIWKSIDSHTDCYFCISNFIKEKVKLIFHTDEKKAKVFYNCINTSRFYRTESTQREALKEQIGLRKDDFVVIYTGRLQAYKGVKELLKGFSHINEKNIKLLIVGGSFYSGGKKNKFIRELEKIANGMDNKPIFTGFVPYETIPNYYAIADVAAVPSLWEEPFALTALEAMASGLPVIATKTGGLPEVVDDSCAILLDKDNHLPRNIAQSILHLFEDHELHRKMSIASFHRAAKFKIDNYWKNFNQLINNI